MKKPYFADTDSKISRIKDDGTYKVLNRSGLSLVKRGNSKYFEGKFRFPFRRNGDWAVVPIGVWGKDIKVDGAIEQWQAIKRWSKANNRHPKFFKEPISEDQKTLVEVANEWMEKVYKPKTKPRTWGDRQNKLNQMLNYLNAVHGEEELVGNYGFDQGGKQKIKRMLLDVYENNGHHYQLVRSRQLLTWIFDYAEEEQYIGKNQNPVAKRFQWEGLQHKKKGNTTIAPTITSKSWGEVPRFLQSINENVCRGSTLTNLAVKAHLLMCIRSGVIVRLQWDWYDKEEDLWVIPAQTEGLKRKLGDKESIHHIPSTPQINSLMEQIKGITGWQKYVFYSLGGGNKPHLGEETLNDHLKNLGWEGKQSAHGWRDVITTAAGEHSNFDYEIYDRQLGRMEHKQGTRGHYDHSTLLGKRREFMEWWSQQMVEQGLKV